MATQMLFPHSWAVTAMEQLPISKPSLSILEGEELN